MGKEDTITKEYMRDAEIFADVFNFLLYDGRQVIKPEKLRELDTASIVAPHGDDANFYAVQKYRDILKYVSAMADENTAYLILGIEDQMKIHYAMPVRNILYDAIQYSNQVDKIAMKHRKAKDYGTADEFLSGLHKGDKLRPVVTLVIYWGTDPWDAPRSLHEMLETDDESILSFVPDYRINLIAPNEIEDEDFEKFHTDLSFVFKFMKYSKDKNKMRAAMNEDPSFKNVSIKTANLINTVAKLNINIENRKDEFNMCKAIEDMIKDATSEAESKMKQAVQEKENMCKAMEDKMNRAVQEKESMCKAVEDMIKDATSEAEKARGEAEKAKGEAEKAKNEAEKKNIESLKRMLNKKRFTFEEVAEIFGVSVEFVENISNGETA